MSITAKVQKSPAFAEAYLRERTAFDAAYESAQRVRDLPRTASLRMGRTTRAWADAKRREWLAAKSRLRVIVVAQTVGRGK